MTRASKPRTLILSTIAQAVIACWAMSTPVANAAESTVTGGGRPAAGANTSSAHGASTGQGLGGAGATTQSAQSSSTNTASHTSLSSKFSNAASQTTSAPSRPRPDLRNVRQVQPQYPDRLRSVGGLGVPTTAFNRRAVGPTNGREISNKERARAYRAADRHTIQQALATRAEAARKAGLDGIASDLQRRADAVRIKYSAERYFNNPPQQPKGSPPALPTQRPRLTERGLDIQNGKLKGTDTTYDRLKPGKVPGTAGVPKWHTHRYVIEQPYAVKGPNQTGPRAAQRMYASRHYDHPVKQSAQDTAMKSTKTPRATARVLRYRGFVRIQ